VAIRRARGMSIRRRGHLQANLQQFAGCRREEKEFHAAILLGPFAPDQPFLLHAAQMHPHSGLCRIHPLVKIVDLEATFSGCQRQKNLKWNLMMQFEKPLLAFYELQSRFAKIYKAFVFLFHEMRRKQISAQINTAALVVMTDHGMTVPNTSQICPENKLPKH
jgi:hypothetical protein